MDILPGAPSYPLRWCISYDSSRHPILLQRALPQIPMGKTQKPTRIAWAEEDEEPTPAGVSAQDLQAALLLQARKDDFKHPGMAPSAGASDAEGKEDIPTGNNNIPAAVSPWLPTSPRPLQIQYTSISLASSALVVDVPSGSRYYRGCCHQTLVRLLILGCPGLKESFRILQEVDLCSNWECPSAKLICPGFPILYQ